MADPETLTIEMEPVRGGQEFGPVQPEPQQVIDVTEEQMQQAALFEARFGATAPVTAKQVLTTEPNNAELVDSTNHFLARAADRADDDRDDGDTKQLSGRIERGDLTVPAAGLTAFELVTKANGVESRGTIHAANLEDATRHAWTQIETDGNVAAAQLEWDGGNEVSYIYDRNQGIELDRPSGLVLSHEVSAVNQTWLEQESERIRQAGNAVFETPEEAALASAYYNGQRETYNSARENFIERNPEAVETLPAAIAIDEVQVRTRTQEFETPSMEIGA